MSKDNVKRQEFKPFISADKILPEFTATSIFLGIVLSIVFGAANAYLGLKVGMTISASIPAAVISMAIIRGRKIAADRELSEKNCMGHIYCIDEIF